MTTYYASQAGTGDNSGSDLSNTMPLATANSTVVAGDLVYMTDDSYTTLPIPGVSGTAANPIQYISWSEKDTPLEFSLDGINSDSELRTYIKTKEVIRGAVVTAQQFLPSQGYFSIKGVDFNLERNPRFDTTGGGANAHHIVWQDCRVLRSWYQSSGPIINTNHTMRGTSYITMHRCHFWPPAKLAEQADDPQMDLTRIKAGANHIIFDECVFMFASHDHVGNRGKSNDDPDWNATLASRDVGHDTICENCIFVGWEHPWAASGGSYNTFTVGSTFLESSEWDGRADTSPEPSTYYWDDQPIAGTWTGTTESVLGEAIRNWSGHSTHLFAKVIGAGSGDKSTNNNGSVNALSRWSKLVSDPSFDQSDQRVIREVIYAFCTFTDNYGPIVLGTTDDTESGETFYSPTYWNCFGDDNHRVGKYNSTANTWVNGTDNIAVWMFKDGAAWKTTGDTVGQALGCVFGRNSSEDQIRYTDNTFHTVSESITASWTEFPITNCKSADPTFTSAYDLTPLEGSGLIDYGQPLPTMVGSGVSTTSATITFPRIFPVVSGITYDDFDETNNLYSRNVWIGPAGGPFTANTIIVNDYSGSVTLGTAASWSSGDEIWPVEPDASGNVDVGAIQTNYEEEPPPGPTPVGNFNFTFK